MEKKSAASCGRPARGLHWALDCFANARNDELPVLAMRFAPELSSRDRNFSALYTDLRQRMPAVVAGSLTIRALSHECKKGRKRKAERRSTRVRIHRISRCGARFAKRARQSAFRHGSLPVGVFHPKAKPGPGFGTRAAHAAGPPPAGVASPSAVNDVVGEKAAGSSNRKATLAFDGTTPSAALARPAGNTPSTMVEKTGTGYGQRQRRIDEGAEKRTAPVLRERDRSRSDAGRCPIVHPTPTLPR
jgi:hypothetical protein